MYITFVLNFLWDFKISSGLDPPIRGEKDTLHLEYTLSTNNVL